MVSSHCLNQCRYIIYKVSWHSPKANIIGNALDFHAWYEVEKYHFDFTVTSPRAIKLNVSLRITSPLLDHSTFDTLRPRHNGHHFIDDISKCIFFNENFLILIQISVKFVPKRPINKSPALDNCLAPNRWPAIIWTTPLSERRAIIWTNEGLSYWRIYAYSASVS